MSYNYRYHQQGVGYIKRRQQLRQQQLSRQNAEPLYLGWIGDLFAAIFGLLFKVIGGLIKLGVTILFLVILVEMMGYHF